MNSLAKLHPKYSYTLETMGLSPKYNGASMPYYTEFNLAVNFHEVRNDPRIKTAGVNATTKGLNHYYNPDFIDSLSQLAVNFLMLHETFHLLLEHSKRTREGHFDHELANIAQDMIINQLLIKYIDPSFITLPKDKYGKNTALVIPKEYEGPWVFEVLYHFIKTKKEEIQKKRKKKEDEKLFQELFVNKNQPSNGIVTTGYHGQSHAFENTLTSKSATEYTSYIRNFTRRCIQSFQNGGEVKLFGHTDSVTPDTGTNKDLSLLRAELFKNAIIENIDKYCDTYAYCMAIIGHEMTNVIKKDMLDFVLDYEELINPVMRKKRTKEIENTPSEGTKTELELLYESYRFTELDKLNTHTLQQLCTSKNLAIPNVQQFKLSAITNAQSMLVVEGLGDTKKIIINDTVDDIPSVLRTDIAHLPQYKPFANVTDTEIKKEINRRVTYEFSNGSSPQSGMGGGSSPESGNQEARDGYGENGQNGAESYSLEGMFDKMEGDCNGGEFFDSHMQDEIPEELREQMVKDLKERLRQRGFVRGDMESILNDLQKKKKDYTKEIKRGISQIKGTIKDKTIKRLPRRGIEGIKGKLKYGSIINVMLDTSGSMNGYETKALEYCFRNDIAINLIQCDTEVHAVEKIKSMKELQKVRIKGGGGTVLQPGIDYMKKHFPQYGLMVLTDGYCDSLDFTGYKGKVLVISNAVDVPISASNGKVKSIVIENFEY